MMFWSSKATPIDLVFDDIVYPLKMGAEAPIALRNAVASPSTVAGLAGTEVT
jgi:hypothetical protein